VWQARTRRVSWVIVADDAEVTLVDAGYPGDRERVLVSLEKAGRSPADVAAMLLTRGYTDHLGIAEHFRSAFGTPFLVREREYATSRSGRPGEPDPAAGARGADQPHGFLTDVGGRDITSGVDHARRRA